MKGIIGVCKNYFKKENIVRDQKNNLVVNAPKKHIPKVKKFAFIKNPLGKSFWLSETFGNPVLFRPPALLLLKNKRR